MIKKAFTIAEVLITLGLIGVLALAAVPTLNKNSEQKFAKEFERVYENLNSNMFYYEPDYKSKQLIGLKLKYNNIDKCTKNCFANSYKTISGNHYPINLSNSEKGILSYGERIAISKHGTIYVDVNGPKAPNTKCRDLFEFEYDNTRIYPTNSIYKDLFIIKEPFLEYDDSIYKGLFGFGYVNSHVYPANTHTKFHIKDAFHVPDCNKLYPNIKKIEQCEKEYHPEFKQTNALSKYSDKELLKFIHTKGKYCELKIVADNFVIKY